MNEVKVGDLIQTKNQWYWIEGMPPIDAWQEEHALWKCKTIYDVPRIAGILAGTISPFPTPYVPIIKQAMPMNTPIMVTNMQHLDLPKDQALVQFLFDGEVYWVRAQKWEHVHTDFHIISSFDDAEC